VDKRNFLIPVDTRLQSDREVEFETVSLDLVSRAVEGASGLGLVILDACRDNPFDAAMKRSGAKRSIGRGLATVLLLGMTELITRVSGEIAIGTAAASSTSPAADTTRAFRWTTRSMARGSSSTSPEGVSRRATRGTAISADEAAIRLLPALPERNAGSSKLKRAATAMTQLTASRHLVVQTQFRSNAVAIRLAKAFGSTTETWIRLQTAYDIVQALEREDEIEVERYEPQPA